MTRGEFLMALEARLIEYLRLDEGADEPILGLIASASTSWVESGIGTPNYEDGRVMMLALAAGSDLYDQRGYMTRGNTNAAVRESTRRLMDDMMLQLKYGGDPLAG